MDTSIYYSPLTKGWPSTATAHTLTWHQTLRSSNIYIRLWCLIVVTWLTFARDILIRTGITFICDIILFKLTGSTDEQCYHRLCGQHSCLLIHMIRLPWCAKMCVWAREHDCKTDGSVFASMTTLFEGDNHMQQCIVFNMSGNSRHITSITSYCMILFWEQEQHIHNSIPNYIPPARTDESLVWLFPHKLKIKSLSWECLWAPGWSHWK